MNTLVIGNNIVVLHNHKSGNNFRAATMIANRLGCDTVAATEMPSLKNYDIIIVVVANAGDEELPPPMENFLLNLTLVNKCYLVVEIGNYFGLENYFGCRLVVTGILDKLNWTKLNETTIDSTPYLDEEAIETWLNYIQTNILRP